MGSVAHHLIRLDHLPPLLLVPSKYVRNGGNWTEQSVCCGITRLHQSGCGVLRVTWQRTGRDAGVLILVAAAAGAGPRFEFKGPSRSGRVWGGMSLSTLGERPREGAGWPSPEFFSLLGLEMRILVHSPARLSICFCTVIRRPGPDLQYVCPLWYSRPTVAQSKALDFLQKRELNIIFLGVEYATNLIIVNGQNTELRRQQPHSFSSDGQEFAGHGPSSSGSATEQQQNPRSVSSRRPTDRRTLTVNDRGTVAQCTKLPVPPRH